MLKKDDSLIQYLICLKRRLLRRVFYIATSTIFVYLIIIYRIGLKILMNIHCLFSLLDIMYWNNDGRNESKNDNTIPFEALCYEYHASYVCPTCTVIRVNEVQGYSPTLVRHVTNTFPHYWSRCCYTRCYHIRRRYHNWMYNDILWIWIYIFIYILRNIFISLLTIDLLCQLLYPRLQLQLHLRWLLLSFFFYLLAHLIQY